MIDGAGDDVRSVLVWMDAVELKILGLTVQYIIQIDNGESPFTGNFINGSNFLLQGLPVHIKARGIFPSGVKTGGGVISRTSGLDEQEM